MPTTPRPPRDLREKLAQLMFVRIGSNLPPVRSVEEDAPFLRELLERHSIGGLLLFNGRSGETPATLARLQSASQYPLLVCADIERGVGQQLRGWALFPHAMAFDQLGDEAEDAVARFAQLTAQAARASGIQVSFAPVADVNTDPRNPIIATRAFSDDPQRAARLAATLVRHCESGGLLTSAKHFPGHGHTHQDSHDSLPVVTRTREELAACDLVPFRASIEAGASIVMSAHVAYPALDASGAPATLSAPILTQLLRNEMGFTGAVCSDSLLMAGVRDRFQSEGEMVLATLQAGVDMLLDVADVDASVEFLEAAVLRGDLSEQRVDEALARIWDLKQRAFANCAPGADARDVDRAAIAEASAVARRAITFVDSPANNLPLDTGRSVMCLVVGPLPRYRRPEEHVLEPTFRERFAEATVVEVPPESEASHVDELTKLALAAEQLVIAVVVKPAAWHPFGLTDQQLRLVEQCICQRPTVVASLGVPYVLDRFTEAACRMCTFSDVPASQRALVDALAGAT